MMISEIKYIDRPSVQSFGWSESVRHTPADVMDPAVPQVALTAGFHEAIHPMISGRQGRVMVKGSAGEPAGLISDGYLRRFMDKNDAFVSADSRQMMTRNPLTIQSRR